MKISKLINFKNENDIHIDINDLDIIFSHEGFAYIKTIKCKKIGECLKEIKNFRFNPKGVIVEFKINEDFPLVEIQKFINFIEEISNEDSDILFGVETIKSNEIEINLIFTGINLNF